MLRLRRATVVAAGPAPAGGAGQELTVAVEDELRAAWADVTLVGAAVVGDHVIVNVEAVELGLGSGGADIVHCNLTRGLDAAGAAGAHVMKLNYTSLQHAVAPVGEDGAAVTEGAWAPPARLHSPAAVLALHGQLAPLAWAFARARPGASLGYVQTGGGALPGARSRDVRELRARGLLSGHVTAGPCYGGEQEAITTASALQHGLTVSGWDAAVVGPGPGIIGSGSVLGHGGLVALESAHTALALGCPTLVAARMSSSDPRERHRGVSHHTEVVLALLLAAVTVAIPRGEGALDDRHRWVVLDVDLDAYLATGLPARSMGREDPLFFAAALAAGGALAGLVA